MPLKHLISERAGQLPEEEMGKLLSIIEKDPKIISLGPGEPDFGPARHVTRAVKKALDRPGSSKYGPIEGRRDLREAIAKKLKKENRVNVPPDQVVVTSGSNEAILLSLMAVVDPGEAVAVADPSFLAFIPTVELLNGTAISLPVIPQNDWQLIPELVKKQIREPKRTRAIIINSPANPTGAVYSRKTLEGIADIAIENDLLVISDEAYEKFVYGKTKHVSMGSLNGMEDRVLTLQSFSKTYGMPGFRVGYATGPKKLIDTMCELHIYSTVSAPTISQIAALAALRGPQGRIKKTVKEYDKRRKFMIKRMKEINGFSCACDPKGAFYIFPELHVKKKSAEFSRWLLKTAKVLSVPGTAFGRYGEGYIRFSYATSLPLIKKGLDKIEKAMKKLK